ncbi:hypothetical protein DCC81_12435 [Chitinophaga parva]|uniref:FTP domain-containing protein n=1 Tax=Chitinophaga parva TaxID=2169414 RepID=A0A2T7BFQ1_9BACT|nr:hypothetical protein [Chitinophaga parva]PUZ25110.1 hypothetical protein DCC81_12435 [Chitinophaga parva]
MKFRTSSLCAAIFFTVFFFNSCKKQAAYHTQIQLSATLSWLDEQKQVFKNNESWIDSLKSSILSDGASTNFDSSRSLVVYRLNTSKFANFLALFFDQDGKVLNGDLVNISSPDTEKIEEAAEIIKGALTHSVRIGYFTGEISISMVNRAFINGLVYRSGQMSGKRNLASGASLKTKWLLANSSIGSSRTENVAPACDDWYYVVIDLETQEIVSVTYAYSVCPEGGGSGGGGGTGAGSASDLNKWETAEDASAAAQSHLCDDHVYNFATIGNSFTAEVDGIGVSLVGPKGEFFNIEFGQSCITIPNYKLANGSQASTALIEGYNAAIRDLVSELQEGSLLPRQAAIIMRMKQLINQNISLSAGLESGTGAVLSSGGCQGTVPINQAKYC